MFASFVCEAKIPCLFSLLHQRATPQSKLMSG